MSTTQLVLFDEIYKPQFSGHETFPVRHGWLEKVYNEVSKSSDDDNQSLFTDSEAIARFGVGKNMVSSMRHWSLCLGVMTKNNNSKDLMATPFGDFLFDCETGVDPYLEHQSSLWALHWKLATNKDVTTWYLAFNHYMSPEFERRNLVDRILDISSKHGWKKVSETTIRRDVECFVRTYVSRNQDKAFDEDCLESPLIDLSIVRRLESKEGFHFVYGDKPTLGNGVFLYALADLWLTKYPTASTLSMNEILYAPGSVGRAFLLDENSLVKRLSLIDKLSNGLFEWSETAGQRQLLLKGSLTEDCLLKFLEIDYKQLVGTGVA